MVKTPARIWNFQVTDLFQVFDELQPTKVLRRVRDTQDQVHDCFVLGQLGVINFLTQKLYNSNNLTLIFIIIMMLTG